MLHKVLTIWTYSFLFYYVIDAIIDRNTLFFSSPYIGGEFRFHPGCEQDAEALYIALGAAPYIFEGYDFGLGEAVETMFADEYCVPRRREKLSRSSIDAVQKKYAWAQTQFIDTVPPWVIRSFIEPLQSDWELLSLMFGDFYLLFKNYGALNSGSGILYYIRCDYTLHLEPYQTFLASNLHQSAVHDDIMERIIECGSSSFFEELISDRLLEMNETT